MRSRLYALLVLGACQPFEDGGEKPHVGTDADDTGGGTDTETDPCATLTAHAVSDRGTGRLPFSAALDGGTSCGPSPIVSWEWSIDGEHLDGESVVWTGLSAGTFEAHLRVTDEAGDTASDVVSLTVVPEECPTVLPPVQVGSLVHEELVEASAMIVSRRDEGVLWTHNDSGDGPRLFAMARDGTPLGTWTLPVDAVDWEDLAWGVDPDTGAPLLFIADTGNNASTAREYLTVYVIEEPEVDPTAEATDHTVESFRTLTLRMPESLNADSAIVDPATGDLFLVTDAEDGRSVIWRKPAPHLDGDDVTLESVGELAFGIDPLPGDTLATGGDITALGDRVVIRTRGEAWMWFRDGSQTLAEALAGTPCAIPLATETLGEAIGFDTRDGGVLTTSEGAGEPIWHVPFEEEPECLEEPIATIVATPESGGIPLEVTLDATQSCAEAGIAEARWDIDGQDTLYGETVTTTFLASGSVDVTLTLTDANGASSTATTTIEVEPGECPTTGEATTLGVVSDEELIEVSGIAVSRADPAVLWVHNDSGDSPRLFALDRTGATLGTWTLDVPRGDIEDIAAGYASDGTPELWLGDIGDNAEARTFITLYRVDEPELEAGDTGTSPTITDVDAIRLTYPDGARNCETLMLDPVTGDLYLVTKDVDGQSDVFRKRAPHTDGEEAVLEHVASITFGGDGLAGNERATGGEFSADGAWIVVRTYDTTAYVWRRDRSGTVDDAFATEACPVTLPAEPQGEAICFDTDGEGLLTISEGVEPELHRTAVGR